MLYVSFLPVAICVSVEQSWSEEKIDKFLHFCEDIFHGNFWCVNLLFCYSSILHEDENIFGIGIFGTVQDLVP